MTLRTVHGRSLTRSYFAQKSKLDWIEKLFNNARGRLNRLGDIVALAPASLNPGRGIALYFSGSAEHKARIEKVLGVTFENNVAVVKFSRMTTTVKLLAKPHLMQTFQKRIARKAA
jgi:hypothetical protein